MNKTVTELERCLLDNIPDILIVVDKQHRIQHINQTLPQYSQQEVIGSSVFDYIPPHQHQVIRDALEKVLQTNQSVQYNLIGEGESGLNSHYHSRAAPLREHGKIIGYVIITTDVTKQIKAETQAKETQLKLLEYTRLLSAAQISNSFAHDLNQPLSAIVNYANGSLRKLDNNPTPRETIKTAQHKIVELAGFASSIVKNVRSFLAEDSNNITILSLESVLHKTFDLLQVNTQYPQIKITTTNIKGVSLKFDEINLIQILLNLLLNSIESLLSSGTPKPSITISCTQDNKHLAVSISDNGPGVPNELEETIFEPMYTTKPSGLGIGLGICHHILEFYKGKITYHKSATSDPIFRIIIPVSTSAENIKTKLEKQA